MSLTSTTRPTRTAFERKCARLASHHARLEARRALRVVDLEREFREAVSWGLKAGLLRYPQHKGPSK